MSEPVAGKSAPAPEQRITPKLRAVFQGTVIVNGGYDAASAEAALTRGDADLVAFGVPFLANPDLPERFQKQAPLNAPDFATFYAGRDSDDTKGYTDYPALR